jgi:hypothetical protein
MPGHPRAASAAAAAAVSAAHPPTHPPTCSANCTDLRFGRAWWSRTDCPRGGRCRNLRLNTPPLSLPLLWWAAGGTVTQGCPTARQQAPAPHLMQGRAEQCSWKGCQSGSPPVGPAARGLGAGNDDGRGVHLGQASQPANRLAVAACKQLPGGASQRAQLAGVSSHLTTSDRRLAGAHPASADSSSSFASMRRHRHRQRATPRTLGCWELIIAALLILTPVSHSPRLPWLRPLLGAASGLLLLLCCCCWELGGHITAVAATAKMLARWAACYLRLRI